VALPAVFDRYRQSIDAELRTALATHGSAMYDMLRYHLGWLDAGGRPLPGSHGKALRPTLCLLACEACCGTFQKALPAAAGLELLHNFSLIHDDIQDDDRERRHRPTVWTLWGKPQAINAGTAMWVIANLTLWRLADGGIPEAQRLQALRLLNETCLKLLEGQYLDISFEARLDIAVADYLEMIAGKTAALIAASLKLGALLATDNARLVATFRALGNNLGFAFQIRDDLLGIWGNESKTGKPVGNDVRRKKKTLPIVYALERAEGVARALLLSIYRRDALDERDVQTVLGILDDLQAQAHAQDMAERYCALALAEAESLPLSPQASVDIDEMVRFLARRDF
jgi:geranylgeranyl diphosphate synthase, type I